MAFDGSTLIAEIDRALEKYDKMRAASGHEDLSGPAWTYAQRHEALNILASTFQRVAPKSSRNWQQFRARINIRDGGLGAHDMAQVVGNLRALKQDFQDGLATEFEEIIHADIFSDFLEMAEYLLDSNYKDASAVMIGSVLEEHLRKLAVKFGITLVTVSGSPKKADALNNEMGSIQVYNKLELKNISAWLDLRNKAAHGLYSEYIKEQVSAMLMGIRSFLNRFPA